MLPDVGSPDVCDEYKIISENSWIADTLEDMETIEEKAEKSALPVVAVDGSKVRSIREAKKLTQLYVANVVGVTTDTISRWENNRYPTIKRDNAEKLATALEVDLSLILRLEEKGEEVEDQDVPTEKRSRYRLPVMIVCGIALLALVGVFLFRQVFFVPGSDRNLPSFGAPGEVIPVQIRITRKDSGSSGLVVRERLPSGWIFMNSNPPAAGNTGSEEVKWLIPPGSGLVTISYTVRVSPAAALKSTAIFAGEIVAHVGEISRRTPCGGEREMAVDAVHWADENGDGRIDDEEIMPAYYVTEEMKGLGLDWKEIEAIWSNRGYRWDERKKEFAVIR